MTSAVQEILQNFISHGSSFSWFLKAFLSRLIETLSSSILEVFRTPWNCQASRVLCGQGFGEQTFSGLAVAHISVSLVGTLQGLAAGTLSPYTPPSRTYWHLFSSLSTSPSTPKASTFLTRREATLSILLLPATPFYFLCRSPSSPKCLSFCKYRPEIQSQCTFLLPASNMVPLKSWTGSQVPVWEGKR